MSAGLDDQLTGDRGAARAERRPQRDFLLAIDRARQQQLADVDTGDQQHDADRARSSSSAGRDVPTIASCAGSRPACVQPARHRRTAAGRPRAGAGSRRDRRRGATLTPGFRRPTPSIGGPAARSPCGAGNCATGMNRSSADEVAVARHRIAYRTAARSRRSMVSGMPFTVIVSPIAAGSPLKRRCQVWCADHDHRLHGPRRAVLFGEQAAALRPSARAHRKTSRSQTCRPGAAVRRTPVRLTLCGEKTGRSRRRRRSVRISSYSR